MYETYLVLDLWCGTKLGIEKARRNHVDSREVSPLTRKALAQVRDARLGSIVDGLIDRHVDDVARDRARDDQATAALLLEDSSGRFCAVDHTVDCSIVSITIIHIGNGEAAAYS